MNLVHLLPVGKVDISLLHELRAAIPRSLHVACEILPYELDPTPSYHPERQQYHSSEILQRMQPLVRPQDWRFLAIADVDLYIPILKYVFGEAQLGGPCAVVSVHRLRQEFYGLDRDDALLHRRLLKESIHEIGHTLESAPLPGLQLRHGLVTFRRVDRPAGEHVVRFLPLPTGIEYPSIAGKRA